MVTTPTFNPIDGQITSLAVLPNALNGSEVMEIVSPGNANLGNSYQVTTATLAAFFSAYGSLNRTVIVSGGLSALSPYAAETTDTQIFVFKTIQSATWILMPPAATMAYANPVLIKDWTGNASGDPITILFSNAEMCDGEGSVVIANNYGWAYIVPGPTASGATGWAIVG